MTPIRDLEPYLAEVRSRLTADLGSALEALVLTGSAAFGDVQPSSDVDLIAVSRVGLGVDRRIELASRLSHRSLPCPARRLEFVLYPAAALREPRRRPAFDLNLNTGADGADHVGLDPGGEASHWFVIDLSIARQGGRALAGPPPSRLFPELPRDWLLDAVLESIDWHQANTGPTPSAVLNACRGWHFAATGRWTTKTRAGRWAAEQVEGPERAVIDRALTARELGSEGHIDAGPAAALATRARGGIRRLRHLAPG